MKKLLAGLSGLAFLSAMAGMLYAWAGERPRIFLRRYRVALPGGAGAGIRILHLSDQHFGPDDWVRRRRLRRLQELTANLNPDLILFTGDFLHNDTGLDAVEAMLRTLPPARLGSYAVLGNHDYVEYSYRQLFTGAWQSSAASREPGVRLKALFSDIRSVAQVFWQIYRNDRLRFACIANNTDELKALLDLYDIRLLQNESIPVPEFPNLWLAGVDDPIEGEVDLVKAFAGIPAEAAVIYLTHNPDLAYAPEAARASLTLSGHTHGGQVVLPGLGAIHTQGTMLPRDHPAGYFDDVPGDGKMIVSRGMGESTPLRFRCPPEIIVIDLAPGDGNRDRGLRIALNR
ncbi:MAG: metallophosphoesterase [Caldilineales bacterium]|nr:metallophosphoesterase [Caldilineales bacterium]